MWSKWSAREPRGWTGFGVREAVGGGLLGWRVGATERADWVAGWDVRGVPAIRKKQIPRYADNSRGFRQAEADSMAGRRRVVGFVAGRAEVVVGVGMIRSADPSGAQKARAVRVWVGGWAGSGSRSCL